MKTPLHIQKRAVLGITGYLRRRILFDVPFMWTLFELGTKCVVELSRADVDPYSHCVIGRVESTPPYYPTLTVAHYEPINIFAHDPALPPQPVAFNKTLQLQYVHFGVGVRKRNGHQQIRYEAWVALESKYQQRAQTDYEKRGMLIEAGNRSDYFKRGVHSWAWGELPRDDQSR